MHRFARNDIVSLTGHAPRFDLAESLGPDLRLGDLLVDAPGEAPLHALTLSYTSAAGHPGLRAAIAERHGVQADDVVLTIGGAHALFLLAFCLCERGDEAVVAGPVFPLARQGLQAVGAEVRTLRFEFAQGYRFNGAAFTALLSPRTRLVSLASPQNPSGVALTDAELREAQALVARHAPQAWLLMDETYRQATFGDATPAASAVQLGPRVVSVASLSKCHGAPGLRIGWAITRDAALREALVTAKFNTVIGCSAVDEALALRVITRGDTLLAQRGAQLAEKRAITAQWVAAQSRWVEWVAPDAGALCCLRLRPDVFDEAAVERFHAALPAREVRVADGRWFGEPARVFRLGFGLPTPDDLRSALQRLGDAMAQALLFSTA